MTKTEKTNAEIGEVVDKINGLCRSMMENILTRGRQLVELRNSATPEEWQELFREKKMPCNESWAEVYMRIAEHPIIGDEKYSHRLPMPPDEEILYDLTFLPIVELKKLMLQRAFYDMMPEEIRAFVIRTCPDYRYP